MTSPYIISKYQIENGDDIINAIGIDPDWEIFTKGKKEKENYKKLLKQSATFVCYQESEFCGFTRAVLDKGFAIYISELYVCPTHRNRKIAQQLIERVKEVFAEITVYVLSDEDLFYIKKGYKKVGSVFEI